MAHVSKHRHIGESYGCCRPRATRYPLKLCLCSPKCPDVEHARHLEGVHDASAWPLAHLFNSSRTAPLKALTSER